MFLGLRGLGFQGGVRVRGFWGCKGFVAVRGFRASGLRVEGWNTGDPATDHGLAF